MKAEDIKLKTTTTPVPKSAQDKPLNIANDVINSNDATGHIATISVVTSLIAVTILILALLVFCYSTGRLNGYVFPEIKIRPNK